jgi:hypothetical protein
MSSFSFTFLYIQFWIERFHSGRMCYVTGDTPLHLEPFTVEFFFNPGYFSGRACRSSQVGGTACTQNTFFFLILFATLAHDSIDTPAHSLVDLAPKRT